jgi:hypothetical protein
MKIEKKELDLHNSFMFRNFVTFLCGVCCIIIKSNLYKSKSTSSHSILILFFVKFHFSVIKIWVTLKLGYFTSKRYFPTEISINK